MFRSIRMARFNDKGNKVQEPPEQVKINIMRKFGGWVTNFYPILKLKYFKESNSWKSIDPAVAGVVRNSDLAEDQQRERVDVTISNNNNIDTSNNNNYSRSQSTALSSPLNTLPHEDIKKEDIKIEHIKIEHIKKEHIKKEDIKQEDIILFEHKGEDVSENDRSKCNNARVLRPTSHANNNESNSSLQLASFQGSEYKTSPIKKEISWDINNENSNDVKKCRVKLTKMPEKQIVNYMELDVDYSRSVQTSKHEAPSRSLQPQNVNKRWKAWRPTTSKPTICGAHISSEATSGGHERHNKKQILLRAVKLNKPLLLENSPKRAYHRRSPNKNKFQLDPIKLKMMKRNLFRQNWIKHHSIAEGKENSPSSRLRLRKSRRITAKRIQYERLIQEKSKILSKCEDGIEMAVFEGKGRGVVTTRAFSKGDFVVEYSGELTTLHDALKRERLYEDDETIGCYMYFFSYNSTRFCVDATAESGHLGRLINHSRQRANLVTRIVPILGRPYLALEAKIDLPPGTELLLDYGDRSREALEHHPWLRL